MKDCITKLAKSNGVFKKKARKITKFAVTVTAWCFAFCTLVIFTACCLTGQSTPVTSVAGCVYLCNVRLLLRAAGILPALAWNQYCGAALGRN